MRSKQAVIKEQKTVTLNAKDEILGRLSTRAAILLRGKDEADFLPYRLNGKRVVIFNTDKIRVTGRKLEGKIYYHYSGYPGGLKEESLNKLMAKDSREVIRRAIYGMLPKNKLRDKFIQNLELYKGERAAKS